MKHSVCYILLLYGNAFLCVCNDWKCSDRLSVRLCLKRKHLNTQQHNLCVFLIPFQRQLKSSLLFCFIWFRDVVPGGIADNKLIISYVWLVNNVKWQPRKLKRFYTFNRGEYRYKTILRAKQKCKIGRTRQLGRARTITVVYKGHIFSKHELVLNGRFLADHPGLTSTQAHLYMHTRVPEYQKPKPDI